jgi:hypothetical protein
VYSGKEFKEVSAQIAHTLRKEGRASDANAWEQASVSKQAGTACSQKSREEKKQ